MKFKVGDKVRILPSAVNIGVRDDEVGKMGIITNCNFLNRYVRIYMDNVCKESGFRRNWAVNEGDVAPVIKIRQQLLFSFME